MGWEILYLSPPPKSIRSFMERESDEARRASLTGDIQRARSLHPLGKYEEHLLVHEMMWIWWALSFCFFLGSEGACKHRADALPGCGTSVSSAATCLFPPNLLLTHGPLRLLMSCSHCFPSLVPFSAPTSL